MAEEVLKKYQIVISETHENLARDLVTTQKSPFTLPLTSDQISVLQKFVNVVFPDRRNKIYQIEENMPPYFAFSSSPSMIVEIELWEKMFSHFFVKPIELYSSPLGFANKRVYFFAFSTDKE